MDARERLHAARQAVTEGRHEEALSEYVWFHHHALSEIPSLYGVRLSFALSYWVELGAVYPPATRALRDIREDKSQRLRSGELNRELFHDVEAINQHLSANADTANLFRLLDERYPEFARACSTLALEALVEAGQFSLAAKYLPEPLERVSSLATRLNADVARIPERPRSKAPRYRAYTWNFALDLRTTVAVLSGVGRKQEAEECEAAALALLKPWYVRKAVAKAMEGT